MNEDQMKELVARVTKEVAGEIKQAEIDRGISISELRDHAKDLGGGKLDSAWTISYNTSDNIAGNLTDRVGPAAWTISYNTSNIAASTKGVK